MTVDQLAVQSAEPGVAGDLTPKSLADWARAALEEKKNSYDEAAMLLAEWARSQRAPALVEMMDAALLLRCRAILNQLANADRRAVATNGGGSISQQLNGQEDAELFRTAALQAYCLPKSHRPIGKATLIDLQEAKRYFAVREGAYRRDRLLMEKLIENVKKGQLVEDVYSDESFRQLLLEVIEEIKQ
jgi:hypothetical protein